MVTIARAPLLATDTRWLSTMGVAEAQGENCEPNRAQLPRQFGTTTAFYGPGMDNGDG